MSRAPVGVELWIIISTCLVAGGWILSALGQLNVAGYTAVLVITAGLCWKSRDGVEWKPAYLKRFRRPLPLLFLVLAGSALIGGALYAPTNWDALAYRIPRVLNWLDAEKWHWIHSNVPRVNNRAAGFEWLMTPLILFTKSDRAVFLINFVSFLLLPGLVFSVFTRVGVRPRVAWFWMWLIPGGYVFALQAGSIGNDSFAAVYALAAVDFALRGHASRRFKDFVLSLLAVGLMTGAKATNLPLVLPWLLAVFPLVLFWPLRKPVGTLTAIGVAALVSFLPTAVMNHVHVGDWSGLALERAVVPNLTTKDPIIGVVGHTLLLLLHNLVPPFFPMAPRFNFLLPELLPDGALRAIGENFNSLRIFYISEMPGEDSVSGAGFGLTVLLLVSLAAVGRNGFRLAPTTSMGHYRQIAFCVAPYIGLTAVMARSGFACNRLVAAFYPFLIASLLMFVGHRLVVDRRWWRRLSVLVMLLAVIVVGVTPSRPLFPARIAIKRLATFYPGNRLIERAQRVYSVYFERNDALRDIRKALPANVKVLGLACSVDDPETSLWRPFLQKRVVHVVPGDKPGTIRQSGIEYVVLNEDGLRLRFRTTIEEWCQYYRGQIVRQWDLPKRASLGYNEKWYMVKISDAAQEPGLTLRADWR